MVMSKSKTLAWLPWYSTSVEYISEKGYWKLYKCIYYIYIYVCMYIYIYIYIYVYVYVYIYKYYL